MNTNPTKNGAGGRPRLDDAAADVTPIAAEPQPLLVSAKEAARLCGCGTSSWWRLHAMAKVPSPIRLAGKTCWRSGELRAWVEAGCPARSEWEAMQSAERRRRK